MNVENLDFDSKTDNPETFSVTLQAKTMKACPGPNPPPFAPTDAHAGDATIEQIELIRTPRRAELLRFAQEAR